MIIRIILMFLFLVLSGLFSGAEIVYTKVNTLKLERAVEQGDKKALKALNITKNFTQTITTILIGNNLVNIALSSVGAIVAVDIANNNPNIDVGTMTTLMTIGITIVVLIFGEILPKTIFNNYSFSLSRNLTWYINTFKILFYPLVISVTKIATKITSIFVKKEVVDEETAEEESSGELINMTDELEEKGVIDSDDAELIKSAIDFTDAEAYEIMVPRVDIIAYDVEDGFEAIVNHPDFFKSSRVPIYRHTIDNIIGICDTTKVLKLILMDKKVELKDVLYEPLYVHKTMSLATVLKELKQSHKHLAIVLDEWAGVLGILTIEDILEELFGEIWDETDVVEIDYKKINDHEYEVDADLNIYDLFDLIGYENNDFESAYSTVGGLCTEMLDKFPSVGEEFDFENYHFVILQASPVRVEKVKVIINEIKDEDN